MSRMDEFESYKSNLKPELAKLRDALSKIASQLDGKETKSNPDLSTEELLSMTEGISSEEMSAITGDLIDSLIEHDPLRTIVKTDIEKGSPLSIQITEDCIPYANSKALIEKLREH